MILAIDPSIRNLGWATYEGVWNTGNWKHGTLEIPSGLTIPEVLHFIGKQLKYKILDNDPTVLVVEYPEFFQGSQKGAVAAVKGTTFGLAAIAGYLQGFFKLNGQNGKVVHYTPSQWKGQIPKAGMLHRFYKRFGYPAPNDHEAEAALMLDYYLDNL